MSKPGNPGSGEARRPCLMRRGCDRAVNLSGGAEDSRYGWAQSQARIFSEHASLMESWEPGARDPWRRGCSGRATLGRLRGRASVTCASTLQAGWSRDSIGRRRKRLFRPANHSRPRAVPVARTMFRLATVLTAISSGVHPVIPLCAGCWRCRQGTAPEAK